jgi:late competence protein required for DNA uptake (superfamily II DNA/RNA helicase)
MRNEHGKSVREGKRASSSDLSGKCQRCGAISSLSYDLSAQRFYCNRCITVFELACRLKKILEKAHSRSARIAEEALMGKRSKLPKTT